jgi:drug/metabolite transporter (DMT)-like permease
MVLSNYPRTMPRQMMSAWLALGAVCIIWGTTYLAIRIALESFGPFSLMGLRYFVSGGLMMAGAKAWKAELPRGRELWLTAFYGVITIGLGTGLLCVAEQWVPSGLSALFIATQPFWMVIMEWVLSGGNDRPHAPTTRGLAIGIAGVALLVAPTAMKQGLGSGTVVGFLILQIGCIGWVTGALLQKRLGGAAHPIVNGAVQQLATGIVFIVLAFTFERMPAHVTLRSGGGVAYLIVFGAVIGYSAFVFAMDRLPATVVSIYTFVNPVVAVFLGWLIFVEPFGWRDLAAMLLIFTGVAVVKFSGTAESRTILDSSEQMAVND